MNRWTFLIRLGAGFAATIGGGLLLASFYLKMPVQDEVIAWVGFVVIAAVGVMFAMIERMPLGQYIERDKASELFMAMNDSLVRINHENKRLMDALKFIRLSLHPGDVIGTDFIRKLDDLLKKTENGKG